MASVGENIRRLREAAGFKTQGAFASALGVPQPRLSDWENDRYGIPETPNLMRIAKTLRVSIDALLVEVDPDYDLASRTRAESAHENPSAVVTFSGTGGDVQPLLHPAPTGGAVHADDTTADRDAKSESARIERDVAEMERIKQILAHARSIGQLAGTLDSPSLAATGTGGGGSGRPSSRRGVRRQNTGAKRVGKRTRR